MPLNRVLIAAPRNATADHTIDPSSETNAIGGSPFVPTTGRLIVVVAYGPATTSTPDGLDLPTNGDAVNDGGLYVWEGVAEGGDTYPTTHGGPGAVNPPFAYEVLEFPPDATFASVVRATGQATAAANPILTGLTGNNEVFGVAGFTIHADGSTSPSIAWDGSNAELSDSFVDKLEGGTDGYCLGVCTQDGYTSASYQPTPTMTNMGGTSERLTFAVSVPTPPEDEAPEFTSDPTVTGTSQVGETLTCNDGLSTGTPTPTITKQWQRDDEGGGSWSDISGETGDTFVLTEADLGCMIRCVVTATNTEDDATANSNEVGPVTAAPPVAIEVHYTGDGTAAGSIGGAPHANEVASAILPASPSLNGLMDNVTVEEAAAGEDEYRAIALVNADLERAAALVISVSEAPDPETGVTVEIGLAPDGAGEDAEEIADDKTEPADVDWQTAATPETGLAVEVPPESFIVVWLHRATAEGATGTGLAVELQIDVAPPE